MTASRNIRNPFYKHHRLRRTRQAHRPPAQYCHRVQTHPKAVHSSDKGRASCQELNWRIHISEAVSDGSSYKIMEGLKTMNSSYEICTVDEKRDCGTYGKGNQSGRLVVVVRYRVLLKREEREKKKCRKSRTAVFCTEVDHIYSKRRGGPL